MFHKFGWVALSCWFFNRTNCSYLTQNSKTHQTLGTNMFQYIYIDKCAPCAAWSFICKWMYILYDVPSNRVHFKIPTEFCTTVDGCFYTLPKRPTKLKHWTRNWISKPSRTKVVLVYMFIFFSSRSKKLRRVLVSSVYEIFGESESSDCVKRRSTQSGV